MSGSIEKAAETTGVAAVDALRKSISGFSDLIVSDVDLNPRITPVLDLSSVKKSAGEMGGILGNRAIAIDSSFAKARYVAESYATSQAAVMDVMPVASNSVSYTQNNYSPKALSAAEIYRQTKNQLSTVKGALGTP
jgi:hypothetical protein